MHGFLFGDRLQVRNDFGLVIPLLSSLLVGSLVGWDTLFDLLGRL